MCGAFAEQIAVPSTSLQRVDSAVDLRQAAAFGRGPPHRVPGAAHRRRCPTRGTGWWCSVLRGASAWPPSSLAHARGPVVAAASTAEKLAVCLVAGPSPPSNYATENLKERIKQITGDGARRRDRPGGWPVGRAGAARDALGWPVRHRRLRLGGDPAYTAQSRAAERPVITGFTMEGFARNQAEDRARDQAELAALARAGRAVPYISATYPLEQVDRALSDLAERRATGKVLVDPTR
jgi:NADPH2:quinone reductase